jgi:hypothetical protein
MLWKLIKIILSFVNSTFLKGRFVPVLCIYVKLSAILSNGSVLLYFYSRCKKTNNLELDKEKANNKKTKKIRLTKKDWQKLVQSKPRKKQNRKTFFFTFFFTFFLFDFTFCWPKANTIFVQCRAGATRLTNLHKNSSVNHWNCNQPTKPKRHYLKGRTIKDYNETILKGTILKTMETFICNYFFGIDSKFFFFSENHFSKKSKKIFLLENRGNL